MPLFHSFWHKLNLFYQWYNNNFDHFLLISLLPVFALFLCKAECDEVRKKKGLELEILTEPIRNWEGDDIKTLGPVLHMSQVKVHTQNCQVQNSETVDIDAGHIELYFSTVGSEQCVKKTFWLSGIWRMLPPPVSSHFAHDLSEPQDEWVHIPGITTLYNDLCFAKYCNFYHTPWDIESAL